MINTSRSSLLYDHSLKKYCGFSIKGVDSISLYRYLFIILLCLYLPATNAVVLTASERFEQQQRRDRDRLQQIERANKIKADVHTATDKDEAVDRFVLLDEKPCFAINKVEIKGGKDLGWLNRWLKEQASQLEGHCAGAQTLQNLQTYLGNQLIHHGYVTSRILLPQQNIAKGHITFKLILGTVQSIIGQNKKLARFNNAYAFKAGDIYNQRDVDQTLENIRSLSHQGHTRFKLLPGSNLGETILATIHAPLGRHALQLSVDNSGSESTGRYMQQFVYSGEGLFRLYDRLSLTYGQNLNYGNQSQYSRSASIQWQFPLAYWMIRASSNMSRYKQTIKGFSGNIIYSGKSYGVSLASDYVFHRTGKSKDWLKAEINRKASVSMIDDVEIAVQERDVIGYDTAWNHRHLIGQMQIEYKIGLRGSLAKHSKNHGVIVGEPNWHGRYQLRYQRLSMSKTYRFFKRYKIDYRLHAHHQQAQTPIPSHEYISIGNRYSVRGFDEKGSLSAQNGWTLRNEWQSKLKKNLGHVYLAIDWGRLTGLQEQLGSGDKLLGSAIGFKGTLMKLIQYDASLGWPLDYPEGFSAKKPNGTITLSTSF